MKKAGFILVLLVLLISSLISAAEIKLPKEVYSPGETLQAEIYGNFLDNLKPENIFFYGERKIPLVYDIAKLKDKYLLYAILPSQEGNYSIKIKNARYSTADGSSTAELVRGFSISQGNETVISVNPGFIIARGDFSLTLKSNTNTETTAEFLATGASQDIELLEGIPKEIKFSASDILEYTESSVKISGYSIPVFIYPNKTEEELMRESESFRFSPQDMDSILLKNQDFSFDISLINLGALAVKNINLVLELPDGLDAELSKESISELAPDEKESIEIIFNSDEKGTYSGKIIAEAAEPQLTAEFLISIRVTENSSEIYSDTPSISGQSSCADLGKLCAAGETCSGPVVFTSDGVCCKGECNKPRSGVSGWVWGVIIIIAVMVLLFFLFYLSRRKQKKTPDALKQRESRFEDRMKGRQVYRNLTRE